MFTNTKNNWMYIEINIHDNQLILLHQVRIMHLCMFLCVLHIAH